MQATGVMNDYFEALFSSKEVIFLHWSAFISVNTVGHYLAYKFFRYLISKQYQVGAWTINTIHMILIKQL